MKKIVSILLAFALAAAQAQTIPLIYADDALSSEILSQDIVPAETTETSGQKTGNPEGFGVPYAPPLIFQAANSEDEEPS